MVLIRGHSRRYKDIFIPYMRNRRDVGSSFEYLFFLKILNKEKTQTAKYKRATLQVISFKLELVTSYY